MAKNKIGLQFKGWQEVLSGIDKAAGESALKEVVNDALAASKGIVNAKIKKTMNKSNLPAHGKYSNAPHTLESLNGDFDVNWTGFTGEIKVGFDLEKSGLVSIFLMYGTPRMQPANGLYDAVYGRRTKNEVKKVQMKAIGTYIKRHLGG